MAAIEISLVSQFDEKGLASLGEEAFHLRGFFNQPRLKVVPLYQQFSAAIEKLSEKAPTTKISKAESEKAAAYLKNAKPNDCDKNRHLYHQCSALVMGTIPVLTPTN